MIIDIHTHAYTEPYLELMQEKGMDAPVHFRRDGDGWAWYKGNKRLEPLEAGFYRREVRLEDMDRLGVDVQAISLTTPVVAWADVDLGVTLSRTANDSLAEWAAESDGRFVAVATLPLQSVEESCKELERAVEKLGMRMAYLGSHVQGVPLDDPRFAPLYDIAQSLGVTLMVHPLHHPVDSRYDTYHLENLVGFPTENALAVARLLFSGTFQRYPRLRWYFTHLGGSLLALRGRWMHGYTAYPSLPKTLTESPENWWKTITLDTLCFDDAILEFGLKWPGPAQLVYGTDYPFNMTDPDGPERVKRVVGDAAVRDTIFRRNTQELLGLATTK